ncbi:MAG: toprim domain-containing protein, partial [Clostridia bacterium]|nr:toprim domain-containing protein [Clostridia bacterium]
MIKLNEAVIVEGKYDKITLENIIDATIITTNGFSIFKDREKCQLISRLAQKNGIIVMTDSDSAGMLIRSHLKQICPDGNVINVYVPQLAGKEKRKTKQSKQGLLGVEGLDKQVIIDALARSGITGQEYASKSKKTISKIDMFTLGL